MKNGVENEGVGINFLTNLYNWPHWRKTSIRTGAGKHWTKDEQGVTTETPDQSKAYRFNYAGGTLWCICIIGSLNRGISKYGPL